jgi:hypothetical protein
MTQAYATLAYRLDTWCRCGSPLAKDEQTSTLIHTLTERFKAMMLLLIMDKQRSSE